MKNSRWTKAIQSSADPPRVKRGLDLLAATPAGAGLKSSTVEHIGVLTAVFSGSQALGNLLLANPDWLPTLDPENVRFPRRAQGLRAEVNAWLPRLLAGRDDDAALRRLRQFKQRELLRIAARDLARLGGTAEIIRELSDVADVCLDAVWQVCRRQFTGRFGQPYEQDADGRWRPTVFCVLGLGKLGGQELNYSSDVDVLFVYGEEGQVFKETPAGKKTPLATMSSHQFFNRLAEVYIAEVTRLTPDGMLYRIDLRLRPEGDAGPLCRSLAGYENYYAEWGQTWERMMLIKARPVGGDEPLGAEFLEMIQPFRYPRSVGEDVSREIVAMKDRIEKEIVGADELERNVKLGRGGIREIEFIVQSQQLLHGGRQPFLQSGQTLPCLVQLARYKLISEEEARHLDAAYRFLRDVEHRLQMEENLQTHVIPPQRPAQERLAKLMGCGSIREFEAALETHTGNVRRLYDRLLKGEAAVAESPFPRAFDAASPAWKESLAAHAFRDPETAFRLLKEFAEGPGYVHVSSRSADLARRLIPRLFALCPQRAARSQISNFKSQILSDPDRVLTRLDSFISAYGTRAALFEMWNSNPTMFELLLLLFDRSEFLAEVAIRSPDLVDNLVTSGRLRQCKTAEEILRDLRHGLNDEDQYVWLRRYHEAELMRIGLRDILGLADLDQSLVELSALADACLQYALEVVMRNHKLTRPPLAIIGLGKLGGREIDYGSDLDLLFVTDSKTKEPARLQRPAAEVMELMSRRTEQGMVFHTDARLRPDGEKGLLVNTLAAFEEYYRRRAQLWEIQTVTRTRPVAGDLALGRRFQELAATLTNFAGFSTQKNRRGERRESPISAIESGRRGTPPSGKKCQAPPPACFTPDWKKQIHQMRLRIQKERTPPGKDDLAIKTGKGGLMDAEFIAQALCLEHGWQEANTLRALERGRDAGVLPEADKLLDNYRQLRRLEGILRRWSYEGETVLPDEPAPYYRVSVRCGFATPDAFRAAVANWRRAIREGYTKVFGVK